MGQGGQNYGKQENLSSNSSDGDAFKDWAKDVQECGYFYKVKVKAGLSSDEVDNRCRIHGSNELEKHEGWSIWSLILEQFNYTLVQILLAAAIISFVLAWIDGEEGKEKEITAFVEPLVVFLILVVNAIVGVWQESNVEKALEGLPCLALGTRKMAQKNALVQKLPIVETLGCTTVICSDKTGTLTTNQMAAAKLVAMGPNVDMLRAFKVEGTTYNPSDGRIEDWPTGRMDANLEMIAKIAAVCNDAEVTQAEHKFVAHGVPTEAALKVLVEKMGLPEESRDVRPASASTILRCCDWWIKHDQRIATLEFDRDRKSMGVIVNSSQGKKSLLVKGAVKNLLKRSSKVQLRDGSVVKLDDNAKNLILQALHEMSTSALRCLGFAYKDDLPMFENYSGNDDHPAHQLLLDPSNYPSIESELIFAGLVGLRDPPREEIYQAIEDCRAAGIRIMVITGDNKSTAEAICREIGVFGPNEDISLKSITGKDFMELRDKKSHLRQNGWLLLSRAEPGHKQEIVKLLKEEGEVVAMTGDGVNEATALKLADIGIAGTEVAKEASDMALADDNFSTVVTAVGEGRSIYSNINAFIRWIKLHFHPQVSGFSSAMKVAKTPYYLLILLLFSILSPSTAEIKSLTINSDTRPMILFEKFGFTHTGHVSIAVSSVSVTTLSSTALPESSHLGFFLLNEESLVQVLIEIQQNPSFCVLDSHYISRLFTFSDLSPPPLASFNRSYPVTAPNEYSLFFANCVPETAVSMVVCTEIYNLDSDGSKDYLSAGQTQLPTLYFLFSLAYFAFLGFWAYICYTNKRSVHCIHLLMSGLLLVKALNLIFATEDKHFVKVTGTPHGWDVLFYIFQFVRVVLLFTVIILIGTGWSFLKPFLQEREKKVLMIVIPLQVLANVASVVIGETGPFIKDWVTWNQVFLLVDIICCCAIIFPIVWSIRSLRETSKTDGKAARNLAKLTLFRQFYIVVIGYLYFTRIVVFALRTIAAYKYQWVSQAAEEIASLVFYIVMFYMFRPVEKNEYFVLDEEEEEAAEMALKDEEFEL